MSPKDKYLLNFSDEIALENLEEFNQNIELDIIENDEAGSISGVVTDIEGTPIVDATVKIFDLNYNPIKHTMTNEAGEYLISDIPVDDYLVYAVKNGYLLSDKKACKVEDREIILTDIILTSDTTYTLGSIYGIVYNSAGEIIPFAKMTLRTNDEDNTFVTETTSASDGEYVFANITAGSYQITATSEDYALIDPITITVSNESKIEQNLYLTILNDKKEGTINGVVTDKNSKTPIANAFVGLYRIDSTGKEVLINTTRTDFEGKYFFGTVKEGKYIVKSKAK